MESELSRGGRQAELGGLVLDKKKRLQRPKICPWILESRAQNAKPVLVTLAARVLGRTAYVWLCVFIFKFRAAVERTQSRRIPVEAPGVLKHSTPLSMVAFV